MADLLVAFIFAIPLAAIAVAAGYFWRSRGAKEWSYGLLAFGLLTENLAVRYHKDSVLLHFIICGLSYGILFKAGDLFVTANKSEKTVPALYGICLSALGCFIIAALVYRTPIYQPYD
jgi:cytochrome bd-type quinol oxidase subunit 1